MNKKATSIVSYCTIIGWLIAYFAGDRENAKFHLNQGLILGIVGAGTQIIFSVIGVVIALIRVIFGLIFGESVVIGIIFGLLSGVVSLISIAVGILVTVLTVIGILNAVNDKEVKLPVIGKFTILK